MKRGEKKGQLALFIIIAIILIIVGIFAYILLKPKEKPKYPEEISKIENSYLNCLSNIATRAKNIAMQKGGYIYDKPMEPEGLYLGNNLNFMGENIPYWIYYDSNGQIKIEKPSLENIEKEIAIFIKENLEICDEVLNSYNISYKKNVKSIDVKIKEKGIDIIAYIDLIIKKENKVNVIREHKFFVKTNLKTLYRNAEKIYEYEKNTKFLENYTLDIITLYGKTTGFEIQCYPLIFDKEEIKKNITDGLMINMERIKFLGNYFKLKKEENKYFLNKVNIDEGVAVNIIYSNLFPTKIDIYSDKTNGLLKFDPIGIQEGINLLGFCYVPYHLVYDVKFPVLFILSKDNEIFKFPLVVVIEKNGIKDILEENESIKTKEICSKTFTNAEIYVYDKYNKKIDADLYIKCIDTTCYLGKTKDGYLKTQVPECVNAIVIASSPGYKENKIITDTNYDVNINIFLEKLHEKQIKTELMEKETALIFFEGEISDVAYYPEKNKVKISEGKYNVSVYVFKEKNITIDKESEICYDVPVFLWIKRKKCEKIEKASFDKVLIGGGVGEFYFSEDDLDNYNIIKIDFERFEEPDDIEDIQKNYEFLKFSKIKIELK